MKRKIVRFILWLLGILVVICLGVFLAFQLSLSQALGSSTSYSCEVEIKDSASYDKALPNVQFQENQTYPSSRKRIPLICIIPKRQNKRYQSFYGSMVVAMWGDKSGMKEFATRLVADSSVAFISMNYELAPDAPYPSHSSRSMNLFNFY